MRIRRCLTAVPLVLFCCTALAQQASVVVTNTAANPLPTQATGTTTVTGTVAISGTPEVNVANIPNVPLDSTTFSTAEAAARNIVRLVAITPTDSGIAPAKIIGTPTVYVVPEGKRLVISGATFLFSGPIGIKPFPFLETANFRVFLEPHKLPPSALADVYVASLPAPMYVDSGQSLSLNLFATFQAPAAGAEGYFQGYLLDCGANGCTQQ